MVFKLAGFTVLSASSPNEALELWRSRSSEIEVLVADFELGDSVTGQQLSQALRAEKPDLKTILLSAYPLDRRFDGRVEGVDFFQKPYECDSLVRAVRRHISDR